MTTPATSGTWILDGGAGWHGRVETPLVVGDDRALGLRPLPGRAEPVDDRTAVEGRWRWTSSLAAAPDGLYVRAARDGAVWRVQVRSSDAGVALDDPHAVVAGRGGDGAQVGGLAVFADGGLVVADSVQHSVQQLSPPPHLRVKTWGARDSLGRRKDGQGPGEFDAPTAVAVDPTGAIFVLDRGNRRVQKLTRGAAAFELVWTAALGDPIALAAGLDGALAVVDRERAVVWISTSRHAMPRALDAAERPASVAFGPDGTLYVGDQLGRIHVFAREGGMERHRPVGSGVTGLDGVVVALVWWPAPAPSLLALVQERGTDGALRLWRVDPRAGRAGLGTFIAGPLDSGIDRCRWHRILLDADVPPGASIAVESYTAEEDDPLDGPGEPRPFDRCLVASGEAPDCLVQSRVGRHLWLRLTFRSDGRNAPNVRRIAVSYPRDSYLQYLPAVFREEKDDARFVERFLAVFQSGFDDLDARVDQLSELFDPYTAPARHLRWLAAWVGLVVDPTWTADQLRPRIEAAVAAHARRGTVAGLVDAIRAYAGVGAGVLEHFRLRRWPRLRREAPLNGTTPLWSRDFYQRLQVTSYSQVGRARLVGAPEPPVEPVDWGANRFSVLFQTSPCCAEQTATRVRRVVEREKPAHTEATLCPVFPRLRVGVQASIGIDTSIGMVTPLVLGRLATLSYDSVLGCSRPEQTLRAMGTAVQPRVGTSTRLS